MKTAKRIEGLVLWLLRLLAAPWWWLLAQVFPTSVEDVIDMWNEVEVVR